ncbi:Hypothetical predicted protein [Olea europaea subsp. europaea]|uniref:Chromo domain-containing protein n=1 Tax=Olea europaea subsp. europaea TaxID=158383 RepID=A0A8S0VNS4_OLEEU|nr:Hypothetical predicted protein [Olea europaea subsp. europaea]
MADQEQAMPQEQQPEQAQAEKSPAQTTQTEPPAAVAQAVDLTIQQLTGAADIPTPSPDPPGLQAPDSNLPRLSTVVALVNAARNTPSPQPVAIKTRRDTARKSTGPRFDPLPSGKVLPKPRRAPAPEPQPSTSSGRSRASKRREETEWEVRKVVTHRGEPPKREFRIQWGDRTYTWEPEENCRGCLDLVKQYCRAAEIRMTSLRPLPGGFAGEAKLVEENCATVDQVLAKVSQFGDPDGIKPQAFTEFQPRDALYIYQVARHFFVILYVHRKRIAWITDGANCYEEDEVAQDLVQEHFRGIEIVPIPYYGQSHASQCATSAAAAAIEFQRYYNLRRTPSHIRPPKSKIERIGAILHKAPEAKYTPWTPIDQQFKGVTCEECGKHWPNAKNRRVLTLHKCPK